MSLFAPPKIVDTNDGRDTLDGGDTIDGGHTCDDWE